MSGDGGASLHPDSDGESTGEHGRTRTTRLHPAHQPGHQQVQGQHRGVKSSMLDLLFVGRGVVVNTFHNDSTWLPCLKFVDMKCKKNW